MGNSGNWNTNNSGWNNNSGGNNNNNGWNNNSGWSGNNGSWNGNNSGWNGNNGSWSGNNGGWSNSGGGYPNQGGYPNPGGYPEPGGGKRGPSKEIIIAIVLAIVALCVLGVAAKLVYDGKKSEKTEATTEAATEKKSSSGDSQKDDTEAATESKTQASTKETTSGTTAASTQKKKAENNSYILEGSDTRYLTQTDLAGLDSVSLRRARNEIYARHGRRFKDKKLQAYFDSQQWYNGTIDSSDFDDSVLNDCETANIAFIRAYENGGGSASASGGTSSGDSSMIFSDSDARYLTESDLAGKSETTLRYAKNEIYARHGRKFKDDDIQAYFNGKSWYHGTVEADSFNENVFNEYERANIDLIVSYMSK